MVLPWIKFQGVSVYRLGATKAYSFTTSVMEVDADGAPNALGEVSIRRATNLGSENASLRTGAGLKGTFRYAVFPGSHATPRSPMTYEEIVAHANANMTAAGGWPAFDASYPFN